MDLNTLWFILIAVLYCGYFLLEGFDMGVGILLPFLGKKDIERRVIINTIGPHWDGNEVWLLTAGGATFAAFPHWYATLFSGFYLPLFLMLIALIGRGVAFEFRSKEENPTWRKTWDWVIFFGSLLPAILWGVAFSNLVHGVPIDENMTYTGGFFNLLTPFALVGGLTTLLLFTLLGAIFLSLKTTDPLEEKSHNLAKRLWPIALVLAAVYFTVMYFQTAMPTKLGIIPAVPILGGLALISTGILLRERRNGWAFIAACLAILLAVSALFLILYPQVMVSSTDPAWSLTIYNASSSPYTLRTMTIIAVIFVPIVLAYQGWTYWVFRKRVTADPQSLHY
jgi:cytochrome d ubiquinol oxidase subunit II